MYRYEKIDGGVKRTNLGNGVVTIIKYASAQQIDYIHSMQAELGLKQPKYKDIPMYRATKIIDKLKVKLDTKKNQVTLFD